MKARNQALPLRGLRVFAVIGNEWDPLAVRQAFEGWEARLVGHLRALGDPIAEIDIGQPMPAAFLDQPQNAPGAEAEALLRRVVKAVHGRDAVIEPVDQRYRNERALSLPELDDRGAHRACIHHSASSAVAP